MVSSHMLQYFALLSGSTKLTFMTKFLPANHLFMACFEYVFFVNGQILFMKMSMDHGMTDIN